MKPTIASLLVFSTSILSILLPSKAAAEFTPVAGWDRHLFPSYIIATAAMRAAPDEKEDKARDRKAVLGDPNGLLGVSMESPADNASVKVTITSDTILEPSSFTAALPKKGVRYTVCPPIKYKYKSLVQNKQTVPVAVAYRVEIAGRDAEEQTVTLTLRSINDCPISHVEGKDEIDVSYIFAAFVNEEHPQIDKILREALTQGIVDSFEGYSDEGPENVLKQAYSLWHVLSMRGVHYSNGTTTAGESENIDSQHVRLIDESIGNDQANCVDGSVLFASLLRKIGIEPFLVLKPEHCYVGFYLDEDGKQPIAVETTLIGSKPDEDADREIEGFKDIVEDKWAKSDTWAAFVDAVQTATEDLKENAKKFDDEKESDYQLIDIAAARQRGILPIPFISSAKE